MLGNLIFAIVFAHIDVLRQTAGEVSILCPELDRDRRITNPKNVAQRKAMLKNIMYCTVRSGAAFRAGAKLRQIRVCLHKVLLQNSGFMTGL